MKTLLRISISTNVLLAAAACWLAALHSPGKSDSPQLDGPSKAATFGNVTQAARTSSEQVQRGFFRWDQLEATDYRTYIANLQKIGCPEKTIREIVVADVHDLYNTRGQELELEQRVGDGLAMGSSLEIGLQQLRNEEATVILELLGPDPARTQSESDARGNAPARTPHESWRETAKQLDLERPVSMPLVFQSADLQALGANADQVQAISNLRASFVQQIGGTEQDPNDPAYLRRWQAAQRNTDEWMGLLLGRDFRVSYELHALNQSQATR
jgi:hypothetical protein